MGLILSDDQQQTTDEKDNQPTETERTCVKVEGLPGSLCHREKECPPGADPERCMQQVYETWAD